MPDLPAPSSVLGTPPKLTAPVKPEPKLRDIGDHVALRQSIYDRSLNAVKNWKPMEYAGVRLELTEPHYEGKENYSIKEQKQAILERRSLGRRLRGTWKLSDMATGKPIDQKTTTIATIPFLTQRGTFIDNGNEYAHINQSRLRAGIYSRMKENGELETFVSVKPGQGVSHRYFLDPEKGVFFANVGAAKIPLVPLLRAMGVTDRDMKEAWGPDIAARNLAADQPHLMRKYHERFLSAAHQSLPENEKTQKLIERLQSMELDPEVTGRTMPKPYQNLNRDAVMDITRRLLAISKGEAETDNRDDLGYQMIFGPEDNIAERLEKDYGGYRKKLLWRASRDKNLRAAFPGYLNQQVRSSLLTSGLGQHLEETNLSELLDKQFRITRMGEGGLGGDNVPDTARSVQNSYLGFIDPLKTPESTTAGVDLYLSRGVKKGDDGKLYAPFIDPRNGETVHRSPQDIAKLTVAFPQQLETPGKRAWAVRGGKLVSVRKRDVDLVLPHFENAFTPLSNLIPMKSAIKGQRASMTSRFLTQALPLVGAESPMVQGGVPNSKDSFEQHYGEKLGAVFAKEPAKVIKANDEGIKLRYADGREEDIELHKAFPMNRRTYYEQTIAGGGNDESEGASSTYLEQSPAVKPGDIVNPGQLLAYSNYTDKNGRAALGVNARIAYLADGNNHEDALAISESFAKRLSSDHMFPYRFEPSENHKLGRGNYVSLFPNKFNRKQLETVDEHGLVKPGTTVQYGDPLVLAVGERSSGGGRVHKRGGSSFTDAAVTWDKHAPGMVTDSVQTPNGMTVLVRSVLPTQTADKLSSRWAAKGVVSKIVPDDEMPQDSQGRPFEVLLNPAGIPSRVNPAALIETALGKIAEKTGQPIVVPDFDKIDDLTGYAQDLLKQHGLSDLEDVIDPKTGRKIPDVLTGNQFIMKLHHLSAEKQHGRGIGSYTSLGSPSKGEGKSKRLSGQETGALLASGAYGTLRDASQIRGQKNEDFWLNFMQGYAPPEPDIPLVYKKFVADLQASGINVVSQGTQTHIMAMTDKDVHGLAGDREVKSGELVDPAREMRPLKGGLFDPQIFGQDGHRWGFIAAAEPVVNPVMEDPVRHLLGLTKKGFEDVIAGKETLPGFGHGPAAIQKALQGINMPLEIARARQDVARRKGSGRDAAVRKLRYLLGAQEQGIKPSDWLLTKIPVLPPVFRQVGMMQDSNIPIIPDANLLYRELIEANDSLKQLSTQVSDVGPERLAVYKALKAVVGLGDPLSKKLQEKKITGILQRLVGPSPKMGTVQRRLLSQTVDLVGRATLIPNPDLDMDSVAVPEQKAWDVYRNFIVRRLKRRGMPISEAMRQVEEHSPLARQEMLAEMNERPVLVSRAPVLHRYGIQAFWPRLTKNTAIELCPMVFAGFGADADGDALNWHVPVEDEAVKEARERLMPSRSLMSPADFRSPVHNLTQEYLGALHYLTTQQKEMRRPRTFATKQDVVAAWRRGEISGDEPVTVIKH